VVFLAFASWTRPQQCKRERRADCRRAYFGTQTDVSTLSSKSGGGDSV